MHHTWFGADRQIAQQVGIGRRVRLRRPGPLVERVWAAHPLGESVALTAEPACHLPRGRTASPRTGVDNRIMVMMMSETPGSNGQDAHRHRLRFKRSAPSAPPGTKPSLLKDLSESERLMFQTEYQTVKKSSTTAVVLAFFLGGIGAHRFYMGQVGLGVLYLCSEDWSARGIDAAAGAAAAAITIIPISAVVALVDCFLMPGRVRAFNKAKAEAITLKLKALRPSTGTTEE